jgi:hypothetical protein
MVAELGRMMMEKAWEWLGFSGWWEGHKRGDLIPVAGEEPGR